MNLCKLLKLGDYMFKFLENKPASTERNLFTRQCIGDALIKLMKINNIDNITVKDIVTCAGVSRMTYYKYYSTKREIITDYLYEILKKYISEAQTLCDSDVFNDYQHIHHCFNYFKNYSDFFLTLINSNYYSLAINTLNKYLDLMVLPHSKQSRYEIYYYAGALFNVYIKWIESNMEESVEDLSKTVYEFIHK